MSIDADTGGIAILVFTQASVERKRVQIGALGVVVLSCR
jgi:hypothetical protein